MMSMSIGRERIGGARRGLLDRLGGAVAAQFPLDPLAGVEHLVRREVGRNLQRLVRKTLRGRESPRLAFITVRTAQHGPHAGVDKLLRRLQGPFHIAPDYRLKEMPHVP